MPRKHNEYEIGTTVHGGTITAICVESGSRSKTWTIRQDSGLRKDDTAVISGLKGDQLLAIAQAVIIEMDNKQ